nr:MAG TPA: hypothetical protein [Caudoviricetes sp.]
MKKVLWTPLYLSITSRIYFQRTCLTTRLDNGFWTIR